MSREGLDVNYDNHTYIKEAPAAYKPIEPVIDIQVKAQMVSVVAKMTPVMTFKA